MATFALFPKRNSESAIAEERDMIVRLRTLRKHSDKQRDIYTYQEVAIVFKENHSRIQRQVNYVSYFPVHVIIQDLHISIHGPRICLLAHPPFGKQAAH